MVELVHTKAVMMGTTSIDWSAWPVATRTQVAPVDNATAEVTRVASCSRCRPGSAASASRSRCRGFQICTGCGSRWRNVDTPLSVVHAPEIGLDTPNNGR